MPNQLELLRNMMEVVMHRDFALYTHPDNRRFLEQVSLSQTTSRDMDNFAIRGIYPLDAVQVYYNEDIPARNSRTVWNPPIGGRFAAYGPEDEVWMRPLGLGQIETIDEGPLFYLIDKSKLRCKFYFSLYPMGGAPCLELSR